jgi:mannitol/fructose-specific phosphotransferase system IIA component (Ntr-type)
MRLAELLSPCQILLDLRAGERWTAIVEMVDALVERGKLPAALRGEILDALRAREDLLSTGVGRGVAIPHAFCDRLDRVVAMFARSRAGIEFEALDGGRVNFVVLFLVPKSAYGMHLHTLAAIARLFLNHQLRERLVLAENRSEVLRLLAIKPPRSADGTISRGLSIFRS